MEKSREGGCGSAALIFSTKKPRRASLRWWVSHAGSREEAIPDRGKSQPSAPEVQGFLESRRNSTGTSMARMGTQQWEAKIGKTRVVGGRGGEDGWLVEGHCEAMGMEGHKERLKQWSDVTPFLSSQTTRAPCPETARQEQGGHCCVACHLGGGRAQALSCAAVPALYICSSRSWGQSSIFSGVSLTFVLRLSNLHT